MNINDLTNGIDQIKLNNALKQLSGVLPKQDINNIMNAFNKADKNELSRQLSQVKADDLNQVISNNPALKNAISSNPDAMKTLNSFLSKNKGK